jgi:acyl-CoA reductase-like NAD-dependent aldehyde dehydrogenase
MRNEYEKYKKKRIKDSERKTRKRIVWQDKLTSRCDELTKIMAADNIGTLDDQEKTNLVKFIETLISEAQKLLEKIKVGPAETAKSDEKPQGTESKTG